MRAIEPHSISLSAILLLAATRFGESLYRNELGWAEIALCWLGLWLLLRGFYGVALLWYLAIDESEVL